MSAWNNALDFSNCLEPLNLPAGGTTGAEWYRDVNGRRWVVKKYGNEKLRASFELCANDVYSKCGIPVPHMMPFISDNIYGAASLEIFGEHPCSSLPKSVAHDASDGFLIDCLLRNWDVVGQSKDNIIIANATGQHPENKLPNRQSLVRIDFGGCFDRRASGGFKENVTVEVKETKTLPMHQGAWLYSHGFDTDSAFLPSGDEFELAMQRYELPVETVKIYLQRLSFLVSNFRTVLLRDPFCDDDLDNAESILKAWRDKVHRSAVEAKNKADGVNKIISKKNMISSYFFEHEVMPLKKSAKEVTAFVNTCHASAALVRHELADVDGEIYFISTGRKLWSQHVTFSILDNNFEAGLESARSWLCQHLESCADSKLEPINGGEAPMFNEFAKICGLEQDVIDGAERMVKEWGNSSNSSGAILMKVGLHMLIGNPIEMESELPFIGKTYLLNMGCSSADQIAERAKKKATEYLGNSEKLPHAVKAIAMFNQTWVEYLLLKRPALVAQYVNDGMIRLARGMSGKTVSREFSDILKKENVKQSFEAVASVASSFSLHDSVASRFGKDVFLAFEVDVSNVLISSWAMGSWLYSGEHETVVICPNCMYSFRDDQVVLK